MVRCNASNRLCRVRFGRCRYGRGSSSVWAGFAPGRRVHAATRSSPPASLRGDNGEPLHLVVGAAVCGPFPCPLVRCFLLLWCHHNGIRAGNHRRRMAGGEPPHHVGRRAVRGVHLRNKPPLVRALGCRALDHQPVAYVGFHRRLLPAPLFRFCAPPRVGGTPAREHLALQPAHRAACRFERLLVQPDYRPAMRVSTSRPRASSGICGGSSFDISLFAAAAAAEGIAASSSRLLDPCGVARSKNRSSSTGKGSTRVEFFSAATSTTVSNSRN